ncbi:hypothetical protein [Aquifex sp.]
MEEIEKIAISGKYKLVKVGKLLVIPKGSVFSLKFYNIDKEVEKTFKNATILK